MFMWHNQNSHGKPPQLNVFYTMNHTLSLVIYTDLALIEERLTTVTYFHFIEKHSPANRNMDYIISQC